MDTPVTERATPLAAPHDRLVFRADLLQTLRVCNMTLHRWMKAGTLPRPDVAITRQTYAWKASTLLAAGIDLPDGAATIKQHTR